MPMLGHVEGGVLFTVTQFVTFFENIQPSVIPHKALSLLWYILVYFPFQLLYSTLAIIWKCSTLFSFDPPMQILYIHKVQMEITANLDSNLGQTQFN